MVVKEQKEDLQVRGSSLRNWVNKRNGPREKRDYGRTD